MADKKIKQPQDGSKEAGNRAMREARHQRNLEAVREAGIPDVCNVFIRKTADEVEAQMKRCRRITAQAAERKIKNPSKHSAPTGLGMSPFEMRQTGAKLKTESDMGTPAKKTTTTKRKAKAAKPKAARKPAAKTATANARKAVGTAEPRGMAIEIGKLASREATTTRGAGASRAELIELTGWEKQAWKWYFVNSKNNGFCQKFGYDLKVIDGTDGETRYHITKKAAKAD